jgi:hypothetical protein
MRGFFDLGITRKGGFFGWGRSTLRKSGSRSLKLKQLAPDLSLDKKMLQDVLSKKL